MSNATNNDEHDFFWNALNYRTASTTEAKAAWDDLVACAKALIEDEREACAMECAPLKVFDANRYTADGWATALRCAKAIRMRSNDHGSPAQPRYAAQDLNLE